MELNWDLVKKLKILVAEENFFDLLNFLLYVVTWRLLSLALHCIPAWCVAGQYEVVRVARQFQVFWDWLGKGNLDAYLLASCNPCCEKRNSMAEARFFCNRVALARKHNLQSFKQKCSKYVLLMFAYLNSVFISGWPWKSQATPDLFEMCIRRNISTPYELARFHLI